MGKSTISMAIFNSFLLNYQRVLCITFSDFLVNFLPDAFPAEDVPFSFFQLRKYEIPLVMKEQKGLTPMILF